jgi:hypothetical protein
MIKLAALFLGRNLEAFLQRIHPIPRHYVPLRNKWFFHDEELLVHRSNCELKDHPLSAIMAACSVFSFIVTLHTCRLSPPSANR